MTVFNCILCQKDQASVTSDISLPAHVIPKDLSSISFISKDYPAKVVFCKFPESFPVIHRDRVDLKCCDIPFQGNQSMNLETEISLFWGGASSVISPVLTERAAAAVTPFFSNFFPTVPFWTIFYFSMFSRLLRFGRQAHDSESLSYNTYTFTPYPSKTTSPVSSAAVHRFLTALFRSSCAGWAR